MAHDRQYVDKNIALAVPTGEFRCPEKGELYWNRYRHQVEEADRDLQEKFLIVRREDE